MKARIAMNSKELDFETLASRARRGDPEAGATLQRELEPQMVYIVRQALRDGDSPDPLTQRIRKEAQWINIRSCLPGSEPPGHVVDQVARRLSQSVVANLTPAAQPRQWLLETVVGI
jgi:hypothetical protein